MRVQFDEASGTWLRTSCPGSNDAMIVVWSLFTFFAVLRFFHCVRAFYHLIVR